MQDNNKGVFLGSYSTKGGTYGDMRKDTEGKNMNTPIKIIVKVGKYLLAILATLFLWSVAGLLCTLKSDFTVIGGVALYFAMFAGWVLLLWNEFAPNKNNKQ